VLILQRLFLLKFIAIEPGLLELLEKVAGVRFFWDTVYFTCGLEIESAKDDRPPLKRFCELVTLFDVGLNILFKQFSDKTFLSRISLRLYSLHRADDFPEDNREDY